MLEPEGTSTDDDPEAGEAKGEMDAAAFELAQPRESDRSDSTEPEPLEQVLASESDALEAEEGDGAREGDGEPSEASDNAEASPRT